MARSYFIFNGVSSLTYGIRLTGPAPVIRGEEAVQHDTIPGRAGDLTLTEGTGIFRSYIQTITMSVPVSQASAVLNWLTGSGTVTFSGESDRQQEARVIGAVTLTKISHNIDRLAGEVQFYCQPLKSDPDEASVTVAPLGTISNGGDVPCRPLIELTITAGSTVTIISSAGIFSIDMTDRSETSITIDCDAQIVTGDDDENITGLTSGDFPYFNTGSVVINGVGWTSAAVTRRCRYL